jgi:hypothetical protein
VIRRLCNARLRCKPGRRCRKLAAAGKLRCHLHGGAPGSGRHLSEDAHHSGSFSKARAARTPLYPLDHPAGGRERARRAIRGPDGRYLPGGRQPPDKYIARAQRIIEGLIMAKRTVPALPAEAAALTAKPWVELSKSEKLSAVVDLGLDVARKILELDVDPDNVRLLAQIKDTALSVISQQIRVDEGRLRPPASDGRLVEYEAAVARYEAKLGLSERTDSKPRKP